MEGKSKTIAVALKVERGVFLSWFSVIRLKGNKVKSFGIYVVRSTRMILTRREIDWIFIH